MRKILVRRVLVRRVLAGSAFLAAAMLPAAAQTNPGAGPKPVPPNTDRPYNLDHPQRPDTEGVLRPAPPVPGPDLPVRPTDQYRPRDNRDDQILRERQTVERESRNKQAGQPSDRGAIENFTRYGLSPPPPDMAWYRSGASAVLVNKKTGAIVQRKKGVFAAK